MGSKTELTLMGTVQVNGTETRMPDKDLVWYESSFLEGFLEKRTVPVGETTVRIHKIQKEIKASMAAVFDLGDKAETSICIIWELVQKQPKGEEGALALNTANYFFIRDARGELNKIRVDWYHEYQVWMIVAYLVGEEFPLRAESQIFSL